MKVYYIQRKGPKPNILDPDWVEYYLNNRIDYDRLAKLNNAKYFFGNSKYRVFVRNIR